MIYVKNSDTVQGIFIPRSGNEHVTPDVPLQNKDFNITENGDYPIAPDSGYQGISGGTISVEVVGPGYDEGYQAGYSSGYTEGETAGQQEGYSSGYTEGETAGEATQKAKLASFTATTNGHYSREDGWNEVEVLVPQTTGGTAVLVPLTADTNTTYFPAEYQADGFNQVEVSVDTQPAYDEGYQQGYSDGEVAGEAAGEQIGYANGYADGEEAQKALLSEFTASTNGVYTSETGYSAVTVNVQGGGGSANLTAGTFNYNGQFTPDQGVDGWSAITVNVPTSAGTIIPITGSTTQEYQANSTGLYSFSITTADTLHRLIISFPQTGETHISAWYSDGNGDVEPTKLFDYSGATAWINSMSIDGGTPIAPTQYYTFGDSSWHRVVFDMTYGDAGLNFADCTALTRIDLSEMYNTEVPYFTNCEQIDDIRMPRAETIPLGAFKGCTNISMNVNQNFPLLKDIGVSAFTESGVYYLGDVKLNSIGAEAFRNCDYLQDCPLSNVKTIGSMAFANTIFNDAYMPTVNNYSIGSSCFYGSNLSSISFNTAEDGGTADGTIHYEAFYNCSNLYQINVNGEVKPPVIVDSNGDQTSTPLHTISSLNGELNLNGPGQYSRAWRDFADTYLPGWTVQESN